jgi:hypothetical protein
MKVEPKPTGFAHVSIANFIYYHKTLVNYQNTIEQEDAERVQRETQKDNNQSL